MRIVLQRVSSAHVTVNHKTVGSIQRGLVALVGITQTDQDADALWMAEKILALRIFPDDDGKMNRALTDVGGGILIISQFTLYGDAQKGNRPSFIQAASPEMALPFFERFVEIVRGQAQKANVPVAVATGTFGAMMDVHLVNDGPVTIILER